MRLIAAALFALSAGACNTAVFVVDGVTDGDTFHLAERAMTNDDPVLQSWVAYSLANSVCQLDVGGAGAAEHHAAAEPRRDDRRRAKKKSEAAAGQDEFGGGMCAAGCVDADGDHQRDIDRDAEKNDGLSAHPPGCYASAAGNSRNR